jgi:glycosyltransferase involved in cell wall biosynthesis
LNKIKILRIIARLNVGGPAQHVVILTEGLDRKRYETTLVYGSVGEGEGDMSYLLQSSERYRFLPELGRSINPLNDIRAFFDILGIIREERPQIVHTHTAKAGTVGRLAAIAGGVPIKIHTFHGHIFSGYFNRFVTGYFLFIERILARFTDRIIAVSEMQKIDLVGRYRIAAGDRFSVVRLGLDLNRFLRSDEMRGLFRKKYHLGDDLTLVGIVGRLAPIKNHEMFVRTIRLVRERLPESVFEKVKFVVAGDGPQRDAIARLSKSLGVSGSIVFTGWETDTASLYADLDIIVLTSKNEGTPLSIIEGLAAAKVIVATDVGGVRDVMGDGRFLADLGDDAAFADRLAEAIMMPPDERRGMGLNGRERVLKNYSKERLVKDIEDLYEELIKEKGLNR